MDGSRKCVKGGEEFVLRQCQRDAGSDADARSATMLEDLNSYSKEKGDYNGKKRSLIAFQRRRKRKGAIWNERVGENTLDKDLARAVIRGEVDHIYTPLRQELGQGESGLFGWSLGLLRF